MTILAMVNADKEGQIESKMMKSRHLEEIREARKKEAEARQEQRKSKMVRRSCVYYRSGANTSQEEKKDSIRKKRKRRLSEGDDPTSVSEGSMPTKSFKARKRVSFG